MSVDTRVGLSVSWEKARTQIVEKAEGRLPTVRFLEQFKINDSWYPRGQTKDHGNLHQTRVLVGVNLAAALTPSIGLHLKPLAVEAESWTAVTHDLEARGDDYLTHGDRAARLIGNNLVEQIPRQIMPLVQLLCSRHVSLDEDSNGLNRAQGLLLDLFKEADALDRVRFPKDNPDHLDPSYLRLPFSQEILLPIATELFVRTGEGIVPAELAFDRVMSAAVSMGIVR